MEEADLVLVMSEYPEITETQLTRKGKKLFIINKIDRDPGITPEIKMTGEKTEIWISVKTEAGLDLLKKELLKIAGVDTGAEGIFTARQRHIEALEQTREFLEQTEPYLNSSEYFDLAAENLRLALHSLGEITGEFTTEDLLGEIFSGFCVGK
jgi:tRNA modification GTPase